MNKALKRLGVCAAGLSMALVGFAAAPASADTINQHFTIYANLANNDNPMTATGPINGRGTDVVVSETVDRFVFSNGSVRVTHQITSSTDSFNPANCTDHFTEKGTYQITGGTGQYGGATGNGTYTADGTFTARRTPTGCDFNGGGGYATVKAAGHTSFPAP
jgi:hypothetical protein